MPRRPGRRGSRGRAPDPLPMMSESSLDYGAMTGNATGVQLLSGVDTLCELLLARRALNRAREGLDATFVSGYPGSPLGGFDLALGRLGERQPASPGSCTIPGLNEELAAAAVWGSQMGEAVPYQGVDGVVGAWYGKGPGLDRSGDVLKHANLMGSGPGGGAVLFVGDDPSAKSSTLPYDTNLALADASVPVLVPADQQDLFDLGIEAFRLSRYCGSWVGVRIVTAVADGLGRGRHRPGPLRPRRPGGPGGRPPLAPPGRGPDPAGRPGGAVARPPAAGRPGLGGGPGPRPHRGRRRAPPAWASCPPGKTYRELLGALEACGADPAAPRRPRPQAGDDVPGGARAGARPGRRRGRGCCSWWWRRSGRSSSSRCGP